MGTVLTLDALDRLAFGAVATDVARVSFVADPPSDDSSGVDSSKTEDWVLGNDSMDLADTGRGERTLAI